MDLYIALEGYTLPCGFITKELTILFPNAEYNHYLFKSPEDIILSSMDEKTVRYTTQYLNNLLYSDGDISYNQLGSILRKFIDYKIYTYSLIAERFIQGFLPTAVVINTQDLGYHLPKTLPNPNCFRRHNHRYCSKAKAIAIKDFVENKVNK